MRTAVVVIRSACAVLVALFLALRVLASAGYMPQLEHGRLTLMLCPDGEWTAPPVSMSGMGGMAGDDGSKSKHHEQCPYAAAAAIPFTGGDLLPLLLLALLLFPLVTANFPAALTRRSTRFEGPYSTGPPGAP